MSEPKTDSAQAQQVVPNESAGRSARLVLTFSEYDIYLRVLRLSQNRVCGATLKQLGQWPDPYAVQWSERHTRRLLGGLVAKGFLKRTSSPFGRPIYRVVPLSELTSTSTPQGTADGLARLRKSQGTILGTHPLSVAVILGLCLLGMPITAKAKPIGKECGRSVQTTGQVFSLVDKGDPPSLSDVSDKLLGELGDGYDRAEKEVYGVLRYLLDQLSGAIIAQPPEGLWTRWHGGLRRTFQDVTTCKRKVPFGSIGKPEDGDAEGGCQSLDLLDRWQLWPLRFDARSHLRMEAGRRGNGLRREPKSLTSRAETLGQSHPQRFRNSGHAPSYRALSDAINREEGGTTLSDRWRAPGCAGPRSTPPTASGRPPREFTTPRKELA